MIHAKDMSVVGNTLVGEASDLGLRSYPEELEVKSREKVMTFYRTSVNHDDEGDITSAEYSNVTEDEGALVYLHLQIFND